MNVWIETSLITGYYLAITTGLQAGLYRPGGDPGLRVWATARLLGLALLGIWCWTAHILSIPTALLHLFPGLALVILLLLRRRSAGTEPEAARLPLLPNALHLLVVAGLFGVLGTISMLSGGGWAGDWMEHYERCLFFLNDLPPETKFLSGHYAFTARPPLANALCAFFVFPGGGSFGGYQLVMALLSAEALWGAYAVLGLRRKDSTASLWLLAFFVLASPVFIQNAVFPWTKSLTAAFVLGGLAALCAYLRKPSSRPLAIFGILFSAGILAHYSAAVFLPGAALLILKREWQLGDIRAGTRRVLPGAAAGAAVLLLWLGWSTAVFGFGDSLAATTTISDVEGLSAAENASKIAANVRDTLVPHFAREVSAIAQGAAFASHPLLYFRDFLFNLTQTNLLFFGGFLMPVTLSALLLCDRRFRGRLFPPLAFVAATSFPLGIAVHGEPDSIGLMHICLQPLLYLALAFLASRWARFSPGFLIFVITLALAGLIVETGLHSILLSLSIGDWIMIAPETRDLVLMKRVFGVNLGHNAIATFLGGFELFGNRARLPWAAGFGLVLSAAGILLAGFFRSPDRPLLDDRGNR